MNAAALWAAVLAFLLTQLNAIRSQFTTNALAVGLRYGPILALICVEGIDWWASTGLGRARMLLKLACVVVIALEFAGKLPVPAPVPVKEVAK